jgi:rhodanese-related sulfurtransferase/phosphohistidine swiveling domain-containing protein/membrane protein insertase Oxa1/YidC/SpoIIIJ
MFAIPSPDVLMNLFATAAQVMGLAVLWLSGGLLAKKRMPGVAAKQPTSRWPLVLATTCFLATGGAFLLYHLDAVDTTNKRLQANLWRSSSEGGKKVGDTSLKTLSYSEQVKHPRGTTTEEMQQWIENGEMTKVNLIDVRETEEVEMGAIQGSWARRYPDLQANADGLVVEGKRTVLVCESGNRSSELSEFFHGKGIDVNFMVGGYEKWVAEGRPMMGLGSAERSDLRALPEFRNKEVLLDTPDVMRLAAEENVLFVDVRYPKEFEAGHLPGAVNLTLRKMLAEEAHAAIAALPKRPIVVPCYDKRSSFYALILGVRLERMGFDFRGRYTVPHEFTMPGKTSEWVAQWEAAKGDQSLFGMARTALVGLLNTLQGWLGSLALAIVAAAMLLRVALAPLAIKAERDGIVQRAGKEELAGLRKRLGDDPVRLRREFGAWLRRSKITPGRNLIGSMLLLMAFTAFFSAVSQVCANSTATFGWLRLAEPDGYLVLPLLAAALLQTIVLMQSKSRSVMALGLGGAFTIGITALVWNCCAGAQLYLVVSFALVVVQSLLVRRWTGTQPIVVRKTGGLVPLAAAAGRTDLGGKAQRLGELIAAGMPVPSGFVVAAGHQPSDRELDRAWRQLGAKSVAVRSSACGEDGAQRSFAGEFRTVLGVGRDGLREAIAAVRASYQGRSGGVVVQELVPADHAGVMFTEDPAHAGRTLVEMVEGLGEGLVSGAATPKEFRFRRLDGQPIGSACHFDLAELVAMGQRLEQHYGVPQDIEWARVGGRFLLLQTRPVTRRAGDGSDPIAVREAERARLLRLVAGAPIDENVFAAGDYAALLPAPTPFSLALMQSIWAPGGTVDYACRRLGIQYRLGESDTPYIQSVFGRCMVDQRRARMALRTPASAAFKLGHAAPAIERGLEQFLVAFQKEARLRAAIDLRKLTQEELLDLAATTHARFLQQTYVEAEVVNLATEAYVAAARRGLEKAGLDAAALLGQGVETVVQKSFRLLAGSESLEHRRSRFVDAFGHRAPRDFELSEPRFVQALDRVTSMAQVATAPRAPSQVAEPTSRLLRLQLQRARRFQELKEAAKDAAMRDLALLRGILLEIGARQGLGDLVFQLQPAEVARLGDPTFAASAGKLAAERRRQGEWLRAVPVADAVSPAALLVVGTEAPMVALPPHGVRGARVAGDREPVGRVVVLDDVSGIAELDENDVLVVRFTDPCWLPAFSRVAGLVTEVGGWLSHAAIQAREHNLPAIVGAGNATTLLRTGDVVRLRRDGVIERISEARVETRVTVVRTTSTKSVSVA